MKRRNFIKTLSIASAILMVPEQSKSDWDEVEAVSPNAMCLEEAISMISNGCLDDIEESDKVILKVPQIAENGVRVPVKVEVNYPMKEDDYVQSIHILTSKNSNARVIDVFLTPENGKAMVYTRIKLEMSQQVIVIVGLSNGNFLQRTAKVKVTIAGGDV